MSTHQRIPDPVQRGAERVLLTQSGSSTPVTVPFAAESNYDFRELGGYLGKIGYLESSLGAGGAIGLWR